MYLADLHFDRERPRPLEILSVLGEKKNRALVEEYREGRHPAVVATVTLSVWLPAYFIVNVPEKDRALAMKEFASLLKKNDHEPLNENPFLWYFRHISSVTEGWINEGFLPVELYESIRLAYLNALEGEKYNLIQAVERAPLTYRI